MADTLLAKLAQLHHELQAESLDAASHYNTLGGLELQRYSKTFIQSLASEFEAVSESVLHNAIKTSNFLFYGDFHTLSSSQEGFLELVRKILVQHQGRRIAVALEIFQTKDQALVDRLTAGDICTEEFLNAIEYEKNWGFPWKYYEPLVTFCIANKLPILAINTQSITSQSNRLEQRDKCAASILNTWYSKNSDGLCLCLIGEHHLAPSHLPGKIHAIDKYLRIIPNIDHIGLAWIKSPWSYESIARLDAKTYCIINASPWMKWQSLVLWEEMHGTTENIPQTEEHEPYTEHSCDFDYLFLQILRHVNKFFGLKLTDSKLSQFHLHVAPDDKKIEEIEKILNLNEIEIESAKRSLHEAGIVYLTHGYHIILKKFDLESFCEISGQYLYDLKNHEITTRTKSNILQSIERKFCGKLSHFILNPKLDFKEDLDTEGAGKGEEILIKEFFSKFLTMIQDKGIIDEHMEQLFQDPIDSIAHLASRNLIDQTRAS